MALPCWLPSLGLGISALLENIRVKRSLTEAFGSTGLRVPSGVGGGEVAPLTGEAVPLLGVARGDFAGGASWDLREEGLELAADEVDEASARRNKGEAEAVEAAARARTKDGEIFMMKT